MISVKPDFYDKFVCIADKCRHSCCIGWEIDIDRDSAEKYLTMKGDFGDELRRNIDTTAEPHFILTEAERCPFLRDDGLCRMILNMGEDSLCQICRDHPRFYNSFYGREECGLGLCCEEAVRLFLDEGEPLKLIETGTPVDEDVLITLRRSIFDILKQQDVSLLRRMEQCCAMMGMELLPFDRENWIKTFLSLERMDEEWTSVLTGHLSDNEPEGTVYERIAEYLIYRHFASADDEDEGALVLQFVFVSVRLLACLPGRIEDKLRLFSSEIEYSDENIAVLLDKIADMDDLLYK